MMKKDEELVKQFLNRLYGSNKSDKTISNYRIDLKKFKSI